MNQRRGVALTALLGASVLASRNLLAQRASDSHYPLPSPVLMIGREGDPDYEFVSVAAAHRLPSGDIVVADWRTPYVRVYNPSGHLLRKLGREGSGPGEFRSVHTLLVVGDTVIVYDWNLLRLTRYLATGRLLGSQLVQPKSDQGGVHVIGRFINGHWLVATPHSPNWNSGPGFYRDTLRLGVVAPSSDGPVRWLGPFPGASLFVYAPSQDKSRWASGWASFAPTTVVGMSRDTVLVGDTSTPHLQYLSSDGRFARRVSIPLERPPDLSAHRSVALAEALAQAGEGASKEYLHALHKASRPVVYYGDFVAAADGNLWVRLFEPRPGEPVPYLILSPTGTPRARVSLPAGGRVLAVQPPWVLCVLTASDEVERVALIRWMAP